MTRSDLAKRLARQFPGISAPGAKELLDHFLLAMKEGLESGDTVELRDFGFSGSGTRKEETGGTRGRGRRSTFPPRRWSISNRAGF